MDELPDEGLVERALGTMRMMQAHCEMNDVATPRVMEKLSETIAALSAPQPEPTENDARNLAAQIMAAIRREDIDRYSGDESQDEFEALTLTSMLTSTLRPVAGNGAELVEMLRKARAAIASLDRAALGMGTVAPKHDGDTGYQYPLRDELLSAIDTALAALTSGGAGE